MRKFYSQSDIEFLRQNYSIKGAEFCAQALGRKPKAINQIARKNGLRIPRDLVVSLRKLGQERVFSENYAIDVNKFVNITSPEVAYFLGYFWADGHIKIRKTVGGFQYNFVLCINEDDYKDIKDSVFRIGEWKIYFNAPNVKTKRPSASVQIATHNKPLVVYLTGLDVDRKSWIAPTKLLNTIPEHLKHYFWRGYMDGDGCFRIDKSSFVAFAGSLNQDWFEHEAILKQLNIEYRIVRRPTLKGGGSGIIFSKIEDIYRWGEYLYQGMEENKMGLNRKYEKWVLARDKFLRMRDIRELHIEESKDMILDRQNILRLIKKYNGRICRKRILDHFDVTRHKFDYNMAKLFKEKLVSRDATCGEKPYFIVEKHE